MTWLSKKMGQFTYFSIQLGEPTWSGKDILDFGGNIGNMLRDPNSTIDVERYWCIDVNEGAIRAGREAFPKAHWCTYDRHCFFFNPAGEPGLRLPDLQQRFDLIVAYSVFTNTPRNDMLDLVEQLKSLLKTDGRLAFTFIDPHHHSWPGEYGGDNLRWRLEKSSRETPGVDVDALMKKAQQRRVVHPLQRERALRGTR